MENNGNMKLENEVIRLRALEPQDLDILYEWENDTTLWELGSTLAPFSRYVLATYIANSHQSIYVQRQVRFIIELKETRKPIGTVDLYDFDPHHMRAGVGILIDNEFQKKGYASQALKLLTEYTFSFLLLHQLYAYIPVDNQASLSLFQKNGFQQGGLLKDWNIYRAGYKDVCIVQLLNR